MKRVNRYLLGDGIFSLTVYYSAVSIHPTDSWDNVVDVKPWAVVTQNHFGDSDNDMSAYFYLVILFFTPVYAVVKETPVVAFQPRKAPVSINAQYKHQTRNFPIANSAF